MGSWLRKQNDIISTMPTVWRVYPDQQEPVVITARNIQRGKAVHVPIPNT